MNTEHAVGSSGLYEGRELFIVPPMFRATLWRIRADAELKLHAFYISALDSDE